jgi:hypothetical protein
LYTLATQEVKRKFSSINRTPKLKVIEVIPVVLYDNADENKLNILADNRGKIGVYR